MKYYIHHEYRIIPIGYANREILVEELTKNGYKLIYGNDFFCKETMVEAYSSQTENIKFLNAEPNYGGSVYDHRVEVKYYSIKRDDFEKFEVKPTLKEISRPYLSYDFDGFNECIQASKKGLGWEEYHTMNYHRSERKVFFIED